MNQHSSTVIARPTAPALRGAIVVALSIAVHLGVCRGAGRAGRLADRARPATTVTLEVAPPPSAAAPAVPAAGPPPARARARHPIAARAVASRPPEDHPPPRPSAAEPAADLTGVTLTNDTGAGWTSPVGNGAALHGPLPAYRGPGGAPAAAAASVAGGRGDEAAPLVPLADLGRHPEPPPLAGELERAYPAEARRAGVAGEAVVRARVRADGLVDRARVVETTSPAFGEACRRVLGSSRWTPPLDRRGAPCATEVRYTCHFEIVR